MIGRIVEVAEDGRHLSVQRGFLVVEAEREEVGRVPLDDVAAVIANAHGITYTNNLFVGLAKRGAPVVLCGPNHAPAAWMWPAEGHHAQTERMRAQVSATQPLAKRLWQAIVCAKIAQQAAVLDTVGQPSGGVAALARKVRSGDPDNMEAQAARRYWPLLMGKTFRRERGKPGPNAMLNYGYTVLRAAAARAVMASGLHPSLGIHHRTRTDAMCLASDVMEPFRPLMDLAVSRLTAAGHDDVTPEVKGALVDVLAADMETVRGTTPVSGCVERLAASLANAYVSGEARLDLPTGLLEIDAAAVGKA